ncbi:Bug family tripartite tricarboxylate transporter substrate binding protein [Achromobacter xylosoxidans]|uniref:Bug family tripartite tricarboxylate transporter substrate binding protein n=1 Tax=Alcaligenes xylosoxydans xylosoxydans TaxID=85698 RepID=UPI0006C5F9DE|nr:tripartite tricarboxylate transporter substrate binding protein BugE [Achromobacter xylosoxidans]KWU21266.1 ABC transporter substrate-binding protein [Achromobacter xylosoxidans]MCZ8386907.1 tripartite tricarboxylate transporter substrate binding protein BugE [Achromobacter xylosoxidans]QQE58199.1 tripartite tricarboxylate transporter substrate binding protein BugE [Achromobacter xylosoxidans]QQV11946.1 tripartite tricarboxylate transporter substrate binding protein BugE [Achromobacter xylos
MTVLSQAKAALATALAGLCLSGAAQAADAYPNKPIRLIVPFAAGGTTDIVARVVAEGLGRELGQAVVVENRGGGGGSIGADALARSTPDGYTLGVATVSTMATNPATNPKTPYNPLKDFAPITNMVNVPNVLTVNPAVPAKSVAEFVALLKANPGKYSYASSGAGGIGHLDGELFKSLTQTDMVHVPYRGSGPALNDVIAGQVNAQFDNLPSSMPHIQAGKLRALAIAAPKRLPALPDVPTFAEGGLPEMDNMAWYGLVAPAGTPQAVIDRIHDATVKALKDPKIAQRLADGGSLVDGNTPAEYAAQIKRELELRQRIAKERNIQSNN